MGFWFGTFIFFLIQVVVTVSINKWAKRPNKGLPHLLGITAVAQCWLVWAIMYMAQMHPLVQPGNRGH